MFIFALSECRKFCMTVDFMLVLTFDGINQETGRFGYRQEARS